VPCRAAARTAQPGMARWLERPNVSPPALRATAGRADIAIEAPHELDQVNAEDPADVAQLDKIDPPLPRLHLRDERLGPSELLRQIDLTKSRLLSRLSQQRHELALSRAVQGLRHSRKPRSRQRISINGIPWNSSGDPTGSGYTSGALTYDGFLRRAIAMRCPRCRTVVANDFAFCGRCGMTLRERSPQRVPKAFAVAPDGVTTRPSAPKTTARPPAQPPTTSGSRVEGTPNHPGPWPRMFKDPVAVAIVVVGLVALGFVAAGPAAKLLVAGLRLLGSLVLVGLLIVVAVSRSRKRAAKR
jgi:hypothetical protein